MKMFRLSTILVGLFLVGIVPLHAGLVITFDEFGNAGYSVNPGAVVSLAPGLWETFPNSGVAGKVLVYNLAPAFAAVHATATFFGDVAIAGFGGGISDALRFTNADGATTGTEAPLMIFYSFDNGGAPADVGNISTAFLHTQTPAATENASGAFSYDSGGGQGGGVIYQGQSDVPEPTSISLFLLGLGALGFCGFRSKTITK
jgi:hypothetical protein